MCQICYNNTVKLRRRIIWIKFTYIKHNILTNKTQILKINIFEMRIINVWNSSNIYYINKLIL